MFESRNILRFHTARFFADAKAFSSIFLREKWLVREKLASVRD